ncbi:MAG: 5-methyltetrahydropteroyltriglutamate--homocysteine S-methyltransferase [Lachnospiraceae bacterium]|nr:5-methyltetrahydropteroyltriglutamate--homocysteine S-methyltransferase [Lachnospiraceae bacterium]
MLTSVIGFPRIGANRELKFALEKYFRGEIEEKELDALAKKLRSQHLSYQKEAGIDFLSSNDFSYYDCLLDTAVMCGIVPARYRELSLNEKDTYFAMARGYQKDGRDVKALAMKKWFNTNYHYIVPELEDDTQIKLSSTKVFDEYEEALASGSETKPVLTGAFTLLSLCRYTGTKKRDDYLEDAGEVYAEVIEGLKKKGAKWIQFDEPSLVRDLSGEDLDFFKRLYQKILPAKGDVKILLQTYFGDVRDAYEVITELDFDGIGLDFIEGKQTLNLIKKHGFPKGKKLFAGLVNGKNIWKNRYFETLEVLDRLKGEGIDTVLSTSCSLLHVPYTLAAESKLSGEYKKHFAYAVEKLEELKELALLAEEGEENRKKDESYVKNVSLFNEGRDCRDEEVQARLSKIKESDYVRLPERKVRQQNQKEALKLPKFPTTTIGSFPQTSDVKKNRAAFRKGEINSQQYKEFNREKIKRAIEWQESIGLDVLVHGEYERNDMVEYFGESLSGYLFTEKAWVQSYGTRCVKPPIIWGDVSRKKPITVEWSVYAQSLTELPVKGMLTGPVTILNWSFPREDISIKESMTQIALAIRDEVLDLEANGIKIIQIDEAALREKLPLRKSDWNREYLDFVIPAFRLVHSGVKKETQIHTHMCYSEFTDIIPAIDNMDADVITFEASRSDLLILDALKECKFETETGPGVYDIHSPRIPSTQEILGALRKMLEKVPAEKLWVNPDCGLKTRGEEETRHSLVNMVEAARLLRKEA